MRLLVLIAVAAATAETLLATTTRAAGIALHRKQGHRGFSRESLLRRNLVGGVPMGGNTGKDGEYFVPFYLGSVSLEQREL